MVNPMLPLMTAFVLRPYHAVSKPTLEAYSRIKRGKLMRTLRLERPEFFDAFGRLKVVGGADGTTAPPKADELREQAAAKFKEANDLIEEAAKTAGITVDELKEDDSKIPAETLAQFDVLMDDGRKLHDDHMAAAKTEGRWSDHREAFNFYHEKATGRGLPWNQVAVSELARPKSLGQAFVESDVYEQLNGAQVLTNEQSKFRTDGVTLLSKLAKLAKEGDEEAKAALKAATDIIQSGSAGPGEALIIDQFLPGILALPQRPLTVRELFAQGLATSDVVSYAAQSAFDDAAAAVAQASSPSTGAKPQSSVAWERRTSPIETIATWMAATRQQLQDAGQVQSLIDNQGRLMLQLEEEDQLIAGNGTSPNLRGIANVVGVQTLAVAAGADADGTGLNNLKSIRTARRMVATGTARKRADAVLMNPNDSEEFDLLTDGNSLFRGGNPVGNFTFNQPLWGLRRVESEAVPAGTVYVGSFNEGATVLERSPVTVFTTDSHSDFFIRNLIVVLFEERLGFPVFFPTAFVKVTLQTWGTPT